MPRMYKRFQPKYYGENKYERKTLDKHGREVVKPMEKEDFEEMCRLCLVKRDEYLNKYNSTQNKALQKRYWKKYYVWYRNYIILIIGVNTGCRIETICEMIPRDFAGGKYTITEHKTGKRQQYSLNEDVYKILKKYVEEFSFTNNDFIFKESPDTKDAIVRQTPWHVIKKLANEVGIEYMVGTHSLRKSYARWKWDETKDLLLVQSLLMHNSSEETMRYICLEGHDVEEARSQIRNIPKYE